MTRLAICLGALLTPAIARASDGYQLIVDRVYAPLPSEPDCTLCHATIKGGKGTITKPFGEDLYARGARGKNPESLDDFLAEAAHAYQDSDGDGVTDLAELRGGTNPNLEGDATPGEGGGGAGGEIELGGLDALPPLPAHGCALHGAPSSASNESGIFGLVCAAALATLRRRQRSESAL